LRIVLHGGVKRRQTAIPKKYRIYFVSEIPRSRQPLGGFGTLKRRALLRSIFENPINFIQGSGNSAHLFLLRVTF
jgi:hypothetical protein